MSTVRAAHLLDRRGPSSRASPSPVLAVGQDARMDRPAARLLRLFAAKIDNEYDAVECDPRLARVALELEGRRFVLQFDAADLERDLAVSRDLGREVWGTRLSAVEAVARIMTVHLEESLATREPGPGGWWVYRDGGFEPVPPWEAARRPGR
jgi:hypothetical protein